MEFALFLLVTAKNSEGDVYIGHSDGADNNFNGIIDEVTIWNRALSLPEIQYLYNSGAGR